MNPYRAASSGRWGVAYAAEPGATPAVPPWWWSGNHYIYIR